MEARVTVIYSATKGYPDTWEEPGAPDEIKIISIAPIGSEVEIPLALFTDDDLLTDCHADSDRNARGSPRVARTVPPRRRPHGSLGEPPWTIILTRTRRNFAKRRTRAITSPALG
ncbi:hypothetical protein AB5I41_31675 [Sphingomonas sp. MMS24-JH45]